MYITRLNSHNNTDIGGKGNPVMSAITIDPTLSVYDENGNYNRVGVSTIWPNPYMVLKERNGNNFNNVGVFNGNLKYKITDWLTFNTSAGLNASLAKTAYLNNESISPGNTGSGQASYENYTTQTNNVLTFRKGFDKHDFTLMGALETTSNKIQQFTAAGTGLTTLSNGYYNLGLNTSQSISSIYSNWALLSYIGRLSYSYNDRYLFTGTVRRDGSSKFQGDNKWSTFPSFGIGWKVSNEKFAKNIEAISNLKIRAGWGITGNQGIEPYGTLGLLTSSTYSYGTSTLYPAYTIGNPSNPDLKWETTLQANIGIDLSLFNNRLNFTADYYNKNTRDLLLNTRIPNYDGGGSYLRNVGKVNNKGIELSVEGTIISAEDFTWSSSVNYFSNRNKVVSLGNDDIIEVGGANGLISSSIQVVKVGSPLSSFYLIPWEGVYQTQDGVYQPGDAKYKDVDGNGTIGFEDRVVTGSALPKFQYGFNNTFNYKNFGLNIFIQGSYGNKVFNASYAATAIPTSDVRFITLSDASNYWTPTNTSSTWRNPASTNKAWVESSQFLQDASFARLKNISLSYKLDENIFKGMTAKFYVSAQNLFTITKYKGFDPEATSTSAGSDTQSGIDLGAYPSPKTFTVGTQITF
jgi:TonB-linked SusC/RagA family outer membrane protein